MPHRAALLLLLACGDDATSACIVGDLADSPYCTPTNCLALSELSQGCIGSHTEQTCTSEGASYVLVGGDDAAKLFFYPDGALAAVGVVGEGADACDDAWYGLDLSGCAPQGEEQTVTCDGTVE
jgi:hypothetical protein